MPVKEFMGRAVRKVKVFARSKTDFLLVFNWHQVTPEFEPARHGKYTWTRLADFERELDYLQAEYQVVPLAEALGQMERGKFRGGCVSLTFDDGDVSMSEFVWPALKRRGLPGTCFINTAYLSGERCYWFPILSHLLSTNKPASGVATPADFEEWMWTLRNTDDPQTYNALRTKVEALASVVPDLESRYVSRTWLQSLDGEQFAIGAHGHEHQRFSMMPAEWQRNDLQDNVRQLSEYRAFRPIFAVPFGKREDWSPETLRIAHEQKLCVVLAEGGLNRGPADYYHRIPADGGRLHRLVEQAMGAG